MAKSDYEAGLKGETAGHDIFSPSYQMGALDREKKARSGGESGGAAGAGGAFAALLVIVAFLAFVLSFCTYPIAGAATLAAFAIGAAAAGSGINGVGLVFVCMVPCYIVYYLCWPLELKTAEKSAKYRKFRLYWRLIVGTYAFHQLGTLFHMKGDFPEGVPLSAYALDLGTTVLGFFLIYLNAQRLDKKYGLAPAMNAQIDRLMAPVLNRIMPPVSGNVRDTGNLRVTTNDGRDMTVALADGNTILVGDERVPLSKLRSVEQVRARRGTLLVGGVVLFFASPAIVKGIFGNFYDILPQLFGAAGLALGIYFALLGALQRSPAGKLGGPFRWVEIYYEDGNTHTHLKTVRFASAAEERLFMKAVYDSQRPRAPQTAMAEAVAA